MDLREPRAAGPRGRSRIAALPSVAGGIRLLGAWVESRMAYQGLPGISLGIVYDRDLIWSRGFGFADVDTRVATTPRTVYRIASITKLFTSTAILQLRDAGALQLDDPVERHLPWFRLRGMAPDGVPITIRHLLTHTAGLPREAGFPYWTDDHFPSREEVAARLPEQETAYPAEVKWKYSNLGIALAGEIVAAASGMACEEWIQQHVTGRLGMRDTAFVLTEPQRGRLATGYGRQSAGPCLL